MSHNLPVGFQELTEFRNVGSVSIGTAVQQSLR